MKTLFLTLVFVLLGIFLTAILVFFPTAFICIMLTALPLTMFFGLREE